MSSSNVAMSRKQIGGEVPMVANEITENCIYSGLFGALDSARMGIISDKLTSLADSSQVSCAIIDLSNVEAIDSSISGHLIRLARILKMVGVTSIFCGISGELAKTMVTAGVDIGGFLAVRDLKSAVRESFRLTGYELVYKNSAGPRTSLDSSV
nr:STAS domain-containing protein [uncultured Glaciecola sp.]